MLIDDLIEEAKCAKKLIPVKPIVRWAPQPRAFLMCCPLHDEVTAGRSAPEESARKRWAKLEAAMQAFVEGDFMSHSTMKQLLPYKFEHWELLNKKPRPSLRVFGRFAKPDVFVGTHVKLRKILGGYGSAEFEHEKLVCEDHWKAAGLPTVPPPGACTFPPGFPYESYITANASRHGPIK